VIAQAKGTPEGADVAVKAQEACAQVKQRAQKAADAAWQELEKKAEALIAENDYDGALKTYAELSTSLADLLNRKSTEKIAALRRDGEGKIKPVLEAAEEASRNAEPRKGLEALAKVEGVKLAPLSEKVAGLKKRLLEELANAAETGEEAHADGAGEEAERASWALRHGAA